MAVLGWAMGGSSLTLSEFIMERTVKSKAIATCNAASRALGDLHHQMDYLYLQLSSLLEDDRSPSARVRAEQAQVREARRAVEQVMATYLAAYDAVESVRKSVRRAP